MGEQNENRPPRGPRYTLRVSDLRAWHVLTAVCGSCGRRARLHINALTSGRSEHQRIIDLERRMRCRRCGNREANLLLITIAGRN